MSGLDDIRQAAGSKKLHTALALVCSVAHYKYSRAPYAGVATCGQPNSLRVGAFGSTEGLRERSMSVDLTLIAAVLAGILSTIATIKLLDRWLAKPTYRELSRYTDNALTEYAERRDALADADPDFLTEYARRVQAWELIKEQQV